MRRMYSKEQLQKLIDEVSRLIAIEELDKVVPAPSLAAAGYVMTVNAAGTGYELKNVSGVVDGATIRPANVYATGKITADEIVENMSDDYTFVERSDITNVTREFVYAGIVKNGNKLTLVVALNITRTGDVSTDLPLGQFHVPSSIAARLYESTIGSYSYLDARRIFIHSQAWDGSYVYSFAHITESDNIQVSLIDTSIQALALNTKYYVRYELTLLLSDNLIP